MQDAAITQRIIGCAMQVHNGLGSGFLESVYQKALQHELHKAQIDVECGVPLQVGYDGIVVGSYVADMVFQDRVLVEIKAVQNLLAVHEVQVVNYLTATRIEVGLLLNFGSDRLQVKRKFRTYRKRAISSVRQDPADV